jgi:hypothetical protein
MRNLWGYFFFNVKHPVVLSNTTKKFLFTVNTTLLLLMFISHINKATYFNQPGLSSGHPVSQEVKILKLHKNMC